MQSAAVHSAYGRLRSLYTCGQHASHWQPTPAVHSALQATLCLPATSRLNCCRAAVADTQTPDLANGPLGRMKAQLSTYASGTSNYGTQVKPDHDALFTVINALCVALGDTAAATFVPEYKTKADATIGSSPAVDMTPASTFCLAANNGLTGGKLAGLTTVQGAMQTAAGNYVTSQVRFKLWSGLPNCPCK